MTVEELKSLKGGESVYDQYGISYIRVMDVATVKELNGVFVQKNTGQLINASWLAGKVFRAQ